jgi:beta-carotene hydroxylase
MSLSESTLGPPRRDRREAMPLLRDPNDLHCLFFHLTCLTAYGVAFWLYRHPAAAHVNGPWSRFAFVATCSFLLGWSSGVDLAVAFHNHVHRPFFTSRFLNRWIARLWTVSAGWPAYWWQHFHVAVHHRHLLGPGDWTAPLRRPDGSIESIYRYALSHWPLRYNLRLIEDFRRGRGDRQRAIGDFAVFILLWSVPFWIDPLMALELWVLPQWLANILVAGPGMYVQHVACDAPTRERPFGHSNDFLGSIFNLTMFDSGYHIEHHERPGVHWTQLPLLHQATRRRLGAGGGRVFPFGFYRAANLLSPTFDRDAAERRVLDFALAPFEHDDPPRGSE